MSQLTITLDDAVLRVAQDYAHQHGQAVDTWVARLVTQATQAVAAPKPSDSTMTTSQRLALVQKLAGSLKAPADLDYKQELADWRTEKYGV